MDELEHASQSGALWVKDMMAESAAENEHRAWAYLRAGLHAVRDRLPIDEAVQLGAQLPLVIRGLYYEGWRPAHMPDKRIRTREDLLDRIEHELHGVPGDPSRVGRALFHLLDRHLSRGEVASIQHILPNDLRAFWSEA